MNKSDHRRIISDIRSMDSVHRSQSAPHVSTSPSPQPSRGKHILKRIVLGLGAVILVLGIVVAARAANLTGKIFVGKKNIYQKIGDLLHVANPETRLIGEDSGQINLLLMGIGGEGHDGPFLSDTIILAQIRTDEKKVSLVSIPRDYYAPIKNIGYRKINSAFAEGYARNHDYAEAGQWARDTVEKVSGVTIPYFTVIDFNGFKEAINLIGGVDVHVDRTFTDYSYPNEKNGYIAPVTFTQGDEHMDGSRALIFARSRHAAGPEGSDFARGQRQQKIITATKEKALGLNLIADAGKINGLLSVLGEHFHTNLQLSELYHLYSMSKDYSKDSLITHSLDPATGLVCDDKTEDGAYILNNCQGVTKTAIQNFFKDSFTAAIVPAGQTGIVWLADTNKNPALYKAASQILSKAGFTVYSYTLGGPTLGQTLVYPLNDLPAAVDFVKQQLHATVVTVPPPNVTLNKTKLDLLVILGKDASTLVPADQPQN